MLERVLRTACFLLMLAMVTIIFAQVIARYVLSDSLSWSEEVGRFLFIWMTFLGAALALRNGNHVALDVVVVRLPEKLKKASLVFGYLCMAIFAAVIVYGGYAFVLRGSRQMSAALQLPMQYVYLVLPLGGLLILFYIGRNVWRILRTGS